MAAIIACSCIQGTPSAGLSYSVDTQWVILFFFQWVILFLSSQRIVSLKLILIWKLYQPYNIDLLFISLLTPIRFQSKPNVEVILDYFSRPRVNIYLKFEEFMNLKEHWLNPDKLTKITYGLNKLSWHNLSLTHTQTCGLFENISRSPIFSWTISLKVHFHLFLFLLFCISCLLPQL